MRTVYAPLAGNTYALFESHIMHTFCYVHTHLMVLNSFSGTVKAMEQADHGKITVTKRSSVVVREVSKTSTTHGEEQLQLADGDAVLKCFSPLLNSMKVFGLYFTQVPGRIHNTFTFTPGTTKSQPPKTCSGGCIYAVGIMVVLWLNVARMFSVFDKTDKFGVLLLMKLVAISATFLTAFQQTACFVACRTGNLDRVFSDARLPKSDVARYRRLAIIHTIVCWVILLADLNIFLIPLLIMDSTLNNASLPPFGMHVYIPDSMLVLAEVVTTLLFILADYTWLFSHSVNYMVTSILFYQFHALNKDFCNAISCRGELEGSIREFRRRHQQLSQSVQNADQFMMISNMAGFSCQILNLILILYCCIFFRNETVGQDTNRAIMYVHWIATTLFGLTLTACQGRAISHVVRVE